MAECQSNYHQSASSIEVAVNSLRLKLSDFSDACQSSPKADFYNKKLDEISNWVKEQKKKEKGKKEQIPIESVSKVLITTINSTEKFKSKNPLEIMRGIADIISSVGKLVDGPDGQVISAVCGIIGALLTKSKPQQPSVVDQLAKVVHDELVHFNKKLQNQKYDGLRRRVSDQKSQLQSMKLGEKLDDPNLWNDYVQFMGELSNRFESPLPFKYEDNLTEDPDVADFIKAVVTFCEAYCCFMALLTAAKGKFADLGSEYKVDEDAVDRKIICQREDAKEKLSFLSEKRYLTFLGRLPYEGGKLTKIVVLSRNLRGKSLVEAVRSSLGLTRIQDLATVESAAEIVSRQSVKVKVEEHQVPLGGFLKWLYLSVFGPKCWVQFINETNFPMKIVSGRIGQRKCNLELVQDVPPHASFQIGVNRVSWDKELGDFVRGVVSTGGYIIIYQSGILSPNTAPPAGHARVIEFALSVEDYVLYECKKINIQDKTSDEFTYGQDTYKKMKCGEAKTLYWFENGMHFMATGEIVPLRFGQMVCRFVVQEFDPFSLQD